MNSPIPTPEQARARLVAELTAKIDKSKHVLFEANELKSKSNLTEEEWFRRVDGFLFDPANEIPNTGLVRDLVRGLLTKRFADQLGSLTVAKFATFVEAYPAPKRYKGTGK